MIDKKLWFVRSAMRDIDVDMPTDEPSHIHIPRPSRLQKRDNSGSSVGPTDEIRELAAAEVSVQAA